MKKCLLLVISACALIQISHAQTSVTAEDSMLKDTTSHETSIGGYGNAFISVTITWKLRQ